MNTKNLANWLLIIAALIAFLLLILIGSTELPDSIWWYVVLPLMGVVAILDIIGLILLGSEKNYISFKPRFRYTKVLVIFPMLFLLTSCMTTNVCNLKNGSNKVISKGASASTYTHKSIW